MSTRSSNEDDGLRKTAHEVDVAAVRVLRDHSRLSVGQIAAQSGRPVAEIEALLAEADGQAES